MAGRIAGHLRPAAGRTGRRRRTGCGTAVAGRCRRRAGGQSARGRGVRGGEVTPGSRRQAAMEGAASVFLRLRSFPCLASVVAASPVPVFPRPGLRFPHLSLRLFRRRCVLGPFLFRVPPSGFLVSVFVSLSRSPSPFFPGLRPPVSASRPPCAGGFCLPCASGGRCGSCARRYGFPPRVPLFVCASFPITDYFSYLCMLLCAMRNDGNEDEHKQHKFFRFKCKVKEPSNYSRCCSRSRVFTSSRSRSRRVA